MRRVAPLLLSTSLVLAACEAMPEDLAAEESAVENGSNEPDHKFPWVVDLNGCYGVLVKPDYVLTAAHCIYFANGPATWTRRDPATGQTHGETRSIAQKITHPAWNQDGAESHDIALFRLQSGFTTGPLLRVASLPKTAPVHGQIGTLASRRHGNPPLPAGTLDVLRAPYLTSGGPNCLPPVGTFCIDSPTATLAPGDSGGGFVVELNGKHVVAGIASFVTGGGNAGMVDVFAHLAWINSKLPQPTPPGPGNPPSGAHANTCRSEPVRPFVKQIVDVLASRPVGSTYEIDLHTSFADSFNGAQRLTTSGPSSQRSDRLAGDFNQDGIVDLAIIGKSGTAADSIWVRESGSGGFTMTPWLSYAGPTHGSDAVWLPGDFDGDDVTDLVQLWNDGGQLTIWFYRSSGESFDAPIAWATRDGGWGPQIRWTTGYFDAGKRADILGVWNHGGANTLTVRRSTGSSFTHEHWGIQMGGWIDSTEWLPGDFNGDGLGDVAAVWRNSSQVSIAVYPSNGSSFPGWTQWADKDGGWITGAKWTSGDYNGDGKTDLAVAWRDSSKNRLTVRRSTGASFVHEHWMLQSGAWDDKAAWCSGRF